MRRGIGRQIALLAAIISCGGMEAGAQWMTQDVRLTNGWNAIFLKVAPFPADLDTQLAGQPVRAVHKSVRMSGMDQFSISPTEPLDRLEEWQVWYPPESPHDILNTLYLLEGGASYLVESYGDSVWTITGTPVVAEQVWLPKSYNLMGMQVNGAKSTTFESFFAAAETIDLTPKMDGRKVYRIESDGTETDITSQTGVETIQAGKAYWIYAEGYSSYTGPLDVDVPTGGLTFDSEHVRWQLVLRNRSTNSALTVSMAHMASGAAPEGTPERVASVPLYYFNGQPGESYGWQPLGEGESKAQVIPAGVDYTLTLAVNRDAMSDPGENKNWQSILRVTDDAGSLIDVPLCAEWGENSDFNAIWPSGLWVGDVEITHVSYETDEGVTRPLAVSSPFEYRLILHQGVDNTLRLLQQVVTGYDEQEGHAVLYSGERVVPSGITELQRISSVVFPKELNAVFSNPLTSDTLVTYDIAADNPVNPWRHAYSPGHDEVSEAMSVHTTLTLEPGVPQDAVSGSFWAPEETVEGWAVQTLEGLREQPITLFGTYSLRRVSRVGVLEASGEVE